ncbi:MAG: CHAT domain-containing protein [Ardenticatenaceae bacterium]|nr:CHAT domain-containing protein [Ardenticatenaceae bacterium]
MVLRPRPTTLHPEHNAAMPKRYVNFEIRISLAGAPDRYEAVLLSGAEGDVRRVFAAPFTAEERTQFLESLRTVAVSHDSRLWDLTERIGSQLFGALFGGEMIGAWRAAAATRGARGVRLLLRIEPPELRELPWELLYDTGRNFFLALDDDTVIVRYPEQAEPARRPNLRHPLRILGVVSNPSDTLRLDVASERQALETAVTSVGHDRVDLAWLGAEHATLTALLTSLDMARRQGRPFHVLHYIGHAGFSPTEREGVILLEKADGTADAVGGARLGQLLREREIHLAVLNACESSRGTEADPFRSLALALVSRADIPAVIANQYNISDQAAILFSETLYTQITRGESVEYGVTRARKALAERIRRPEWITTVFHSRLRQALDLGLEPMDWLDFVLVRMPYFWASVVSVATFLAFVTVWSTIRQQGWLVGGALQLLVWLLAAWLVLDRFDKLVRHWKLAAIAVALGTAAGSLWFLWNPVVTVPSPPPGFRLVLEEPPPLVFLLEDAKGIRFSTTVRGRVENLPPEQTIWILVRAENSATFVPGARARVLPDGTFVAEEVIVGPGSPRRVGNRIYTIQPVLADPAANRFFQHHSNDLWLYFHPDVVVRPEPHLQSALVVRR